jgi:hypothetical protein
MGVAEQRTAAREKARQQEELREAQLEKRR